MPPPPNKRMTAQPVRARHFAGKPSATEVEDSSSEEEPSSEDEAKTSAKSQPFAKPKPAPLASSFPKSALRTNLAARRQSEAARRQLEDEFETESDNSGSANGSASGSSSEEEGSSAAEEGSSADEAPQRLLRPVFLKKSQRTKGAAPTTTADEAAQGDERRKREQARALVQEQVEARVAEKARARKDWDDDVEEADMDAVDDHDGADPAAEYAAWKLRELRRIKRERAAIEEAEAERAEIERRRNLTAAEREDEDRDFIERQKAERGDRGDMHFMQKYFHKGAFFQQELKDLGVDQRNVMSARFEDATNREVLPEYMQIRDMTKLGKKGRTRYRDMKSEDTGRWGDFEDNRGTRDKSDHGLDERFKSDNHRGRWKWDGEGPSGANAKPLGERKRFGDEAGRENKRLRFGD